MTRSRSRTIDELGLVMRRFMAYAVLFQDAVARRAGINATDLQCLSLLMMDGPMTPGVLAERSGVTTGGAITTVVDRLERAGLARRDRADDDRRKVIVTADAGEVGRRLAPLYDGVQRQWQVHLDGLTDDEIQLAVRLFSAAAEINENATANLRARP
jgi:DNA-binding MarR family transcriptional regulator